LEDRVRQVRDRCPRQDLGDAGVDHGLLLAACLFDIGTVERVPHHGLVRPGVDQDDRRLSDAFLDLRPHVTILLQPRLVFLDVAVLEFLLHKQSAEPLDPAEIGV
jgi:hypothetical protein